MRRRFGRLRRPLALTRREREVERVPAAVGSGYADRAAVALDDPPADREPEAGAFLAALPAHALERLEDAAAVLERDRGPFAPNREAPLAELSCGVDADQPRSARAVLERVEDQVGEDTG